MSRSRGHADGEPHALSRRRVLVGSVTATACLVGLPSVASAQGTVVGLIPTPEQWEDEDLTGFEIRLGSDDGDEGDDTGGGDGGGDDTGGGDDGNESGDDGGDDAGDGGDGGDVPECDFRDWPPDEVESHEARLVNRHDEETPAEPTTLYVSADVDAEGDAPYVINMHEDCETDYVGVELETVEGARERDDDPEEVTEDDPQEEGDGPETPDPAGGGDDTPRSGEDDGIGVFGPGFGLPAAVAAIFGWAVYRWRRD